MAFELQYTPSDGYTQTRVKVIGGWFTIGVAGAITAQAVTSGGSGGTCAATISRTTTGDYRAALNRGYKRVINADASCVMPAAATAPTVAAGNDCFIQGITAANFAGTSPISSFAITTVRSDTDALADPTNGVTITYEITVADL